MKRGILMAFIIPGLLNAQEVCGFFNQDVIIENASNIGRVGEEKWVIREFDSSVEAVGKIKIREQYEDMAIATVSRVEPGHRIAIGDQVVSWHHDFSGLLERTRPRPIQRPSVVIYDPPIKRNNTPVFRRLRIGLSLGTLLPYQTLYQRTNYSYQAGAALQIGFTPRSALLLDAMVSFMDERSLVTNTPHLSNRSVINVNGIYRQGLFHALYMDLGAGVYIPRVSVSADTENRQIESLEYHYGICAGLALNLVETPSMSVFLSPRYHTYLIGSEAVENVSVGMNFIL
jgi:hypothetical protein